MDSLMSFDAFLMGNRSNGNGGERRKGVMMECFFNKDTSYGSIMERTHQCHHHQNHDGSKIGGFGGSEKGELMIDLNLGRLVCGTGNSSSSSSSLNNVKEKVMSLSSSSLLKRGRSSCSSSASSAGGQIPRCQVQGCNLDLSCSKEYHKRHKVCDVHSKTTKVIVNDLEQRFCQQCSRFHLLVEFDEAKRSCRKRLAGHNERRRKPQVAVYSGKAGKLLPVYQGSRYPGNSYIGQNVFGNGHLHEIKFGNGNWFRPVKKEGDEAYNSKLHLSNVNQPSVLKPSLGLYGSREQISSFSNAASGTVGSDNNSDYSQMFTPPLSQSLFQTSSSVTFTGFDAVSSVPSLTRVSDSVCALSLLSTQSWSSSTHSLGTAIPSPLMVQGENALHNSGHFPDKLVAIGSQMSSSVESNRFSSSGIHSAEDDLVSGMKVPDISTVMGFGEIHADNVFQGLDLARANPSHTTEQTIDLLQLSSMLQNAEQQRRAEQERQGNEPFDWRHLA